MNKAYTRINFQNSPSTATPLNADNLNKMDKAINDIDNRVIELAGYQEEAEEAAESASASASAASKAAETATADAEARVNAIIEGLEVYTKEESHKKFASVIKQTVTGSPILIKDSADAGAIDFKGKGRSTQKQYSGKNKLKCNYLPSAVTSNGVTFTPVYDDNGSLLYINVNGTATDNAYTIISDPEPLPAGSYILSGCPSGGSESTYRMYTNSANYFDYGSGATFTLTNEYKFTNVVIYVFKGQTVNNLKFYPMIRLASVTDGTYEPYVGGTASPNPNYPQTIESVADGGWFDGELLQGDYNTSNGEYRNLSGYVCGKNHIPCKSGDIVNISLENLSTNIYIYYHNDNGFVSSKNKLNTNSAEFTIPSGITSCKLCIGSGSTNLANAPHICVTINDTYALKVKSVGKNLFNNNISTLTYKGVTYTINDDGSITMTGKATENSSVTIGSVVLPKGSYIISGYPNIDGRFSVTLNNVTYSSVANSNSSFVVTEKTEIKPYIIVVANVTYNHTIYPMIKRAEVTDDAYEPYKETVSYIQLSEPLRSSLDGSVTDVASLDEVNRKFAEVVLDGTNLTMTYADSNIAFISLSNIGNSAICSHFTYNNDSQIWDNKNAGDILLDGEFCIRTTVHDRIYFKKSDLTTLGEWETWLQANPITVQYELAEPITETIKPVDIATYNSVTYITATDNAEMEVTYAADTKKYIDNKFAELKAAILSANA